MTLPTHLRTLRNYALSYGTFVVVLFAITWLWLTFAFGALNGQLLTITPHNPSTVLPLELLEQLNHSPRLSYQQGQSLSVGHSQVVLSYRNVIDTQATALGVNHNVTRIGTNANLPATVGYRLVAGHFLRPQYLLDRQQVAVLNEAAAFTLFGVSDPVGQLVSLGGVTYRVIGVIADNSADDELHVYAPATLYDTHVREIVVNLALNAQHSPDYVISLLRSVGVSDSSHDFVWD